MTGEEKENHSRTRTVIPNQPSSQIVIWDSESGRIIQDWSIEQKIQNITFSPYGGRLAYGQIVSQNQPNALEIIVPAPSIDKLNAIAALCVRDSVQRTESVSALTRTPLTMLDGLPDFVAQIENLPADAIPAACKADLLAVSEALMVQP